MLGKIGIKSEAALNALIPLLKDPGRDVRGNAAEALGKIGTSATRAVPLLKELYEKEKNYKKKFYLLQALVRIEPDNKDYLALMIEELLPHPLMLWSPPGLKKKQ